MFRIAFQMDVVSRWKVFLTLSSRLFSFSTLLNFSITWRSNSLSSLMDCWKYISASNTIHKLVADINLPGHWLLKTDLLVFWPPHAFKTLRTGVAFCIRRVAFWQPAAHLRCLSSNPQIAHRSLQRITYFASSRKKHTALTQAAFLIFATVQFVFVWIDLMLVDIRFHGELFSQLVSSNAGFSVSDTCKRQPGMNKVSWSRGGLKKAKAPLTHFSEIFKKAKGRPLTHLA